MDQRLRTLERSARAAGGDPEPARRYRAALERLAAAAPEEAGRGLDALVGALALGAALGDDADPDAEPSPRWRRETGGPAPLLRPPCPPEGLARRWEAEGDARWIGAGAVLLERPDRALEARCPATGAVLWEVPSVRPGPPAGVLDDERTSSLAWAVAPWGAVELGARLEAEVGWRRVGSYTPQGRTTRRERVERAAVTVEVTLQVALAGAGGWRATPRALRASAGTGEPLLDGDLALEGWEDDLLALVLDPRAPAFAVRWRDGEQDWAVYAVDPGEDGDAPACEPAGWSVAGDDEPFPLEADGDPAGAAPLGVQAWAPLGAGAEPASLELLDGGVLALRPRDGGRALGVVTAAGWRALEPVVEAASGRRLRLAHEVRPGFDAYGSPATVLVGPCGRLYLQLGRERLVAFGGAAA